MKTKEKAVLRRLKSWAAGARRQSLKTVPVLALALGTFLSVQTAQAQVYPQSRALVVGNDRGGLLTDRIKQIASLRRTGQPVRITGNVCFSTCTMLLALPQTCISSRTTFGFHGPSSYGRALEPARFNHASAIIANHYPEQLKTWYMNKARYKIRSVSRVKATELIKMGIRQC